MSLRVIPIGFDKPSRLLGISQVSVSKWRTGKAFPDDERCAKIAELLNLDAAYVLAIVHGERAKSKETRETWRRVAQAFASVMVGVGMVTAIGVTPEAQAAAFNSNGIAVRSAGSTGGNAPGAGHKYTLRGNRRRKGRASAFAALALAALGLGAPRLGVA